METVSEENKGLVWVLLRQLRPGMDLSRVVLPTFVLEPRSFLSKLSDHYCHADLLSRCAAAGEWPRGREGPRRRGPQGAGGQEHPGRPGRCQGQQFSLRPSVGWSRRFWSLPGGIPQVRAAWHGGGSSASGSRWPAAAQWTKLGWPIVWSGEGWPGTLGRLRAPPPHGRAAREDNAYGRMKLVLRWYLSGFYKKPKVSLTESRVPRPGRPGCPHG